MVLFSLTTTGSQVRIRAVKSATPTSLIKKEDQNPRETMGLRLDLPRKLLFMRLQDPQLLPCDCTSLAKKNLGTKVLKNDPPTAKTRCDTSSEVKLRILRYGIVMRSIHSDRTRLTCESTSRRVQTMKLDLLTSQSFFDISGEQPSHCQKAGRRTEERQIPKPQVLCERALATEMLEAESQNLSRTYGLHDPHPCKQPCALLCWK